MRTLAAVLVVSLVSCAPRPDAPAAQPPPRPEWVTLGSTFVNRGGKRIMQGVGAVSNVKNKALRQSMADNRARAEVTRLVEDYVSTLVKDYMDSVPPPDKIAEEQNVAALIVGLCASSAYKTEVENRFVADDGTMFTLAELDVERIREAAAKLKEASPQGREFLVKQADARFDAFKTEDERKRGQPGICRYRLRVKELSRTPEECAVEIATELPIVAFPCAGGDIEALFGKTLLKGHVGAAGSIDLAGDGKRDTCATQAKISGQLKGDMAFEYVETGACDKPCSAQAKIATD